MRRLLLLLTALSLLASPARAQDPYYTFEQVAVANTAIGFTASKIVSGGGHGQAVNAVCRAETAEMRYTIDGTTPTSSVGTLLEIGDVLTLNDPVQMQRFLAIRTGGTSGQLSCYYSSRQGALVAPNASISTTVNATNPAAGATGSAVPAQASYTGVKIGANLVGQTGFTVGSASAAAVQIVDNTGTAITSFGGGTQYTNASVQATPTGTVALGWDGTAVRALSTNTSGQLSINATQAGTWTVQPGNTANTTPWLVTPKGVQDSTGVDMTDTSLHALKTENVNGSNTVTDAATQSTGASSVATVDGYQFAFDNVGSNYARVFLDPCQSAAKAYVSINQTATTQILGLAGSAKNYYVCSVSLVSATAQNIALIDSTTAGNACATSPEGMDGFGGSTAATGYNLAANGGITFGSGVGALGKTHSTNTAICIAQSGAGQVSGGISYVIR